MMMRTPIVVAIVLVLAGGHRAAHAQYAMPTDRDFALDLWNGNATGGVRVIGMGGTGVALAEGSVGTLSNAASPAVRRTTRSGTFAWDFHIDGQSATAAKDFDNNGLSDTDASASQLATVGIVIQYRRWGFGVVATTTSTQIVEDDGDPATQDGVLEPQGSIGKLAVARSFGDGEDHTFGAALRFGSLSMVRPRPGLDDFVLFNIAGPTLEGGYIWRPANGDLRVGGNGALPITRTDVTVTDCNPLSCEGYVLPETVKAAWQLAGGVAYRFGPTPWNIKYKEQYRDELAAVVAADLVVTGAVDNAYGLEAFARHMLQPSGREVVVSPRLGAEFEAWPGWVRVRAGSYYEPGRFEGKDGRVHGTAGLDVRLFEFHLWGGYYRPQLSFVGDVADGYGNTGASIGLWN
jgi:hypothetical protein